MSKLRPNRDTENKLMPRLAFDGLAGLQASGLILAAHGVDPRPSPPTIAPGDQFCGELAPELVRRCLSLPFFYPRAARMLWLGGHS